MSTDIQEAKERKNNSRSPVPAYLRIEEDIRVMVADGRLAIGSKLASRHNIAKEYGVALSTAQQAITNLIADGILESFDRQGTFVARRRSLERTPVVPEAVAERSTPLMDATPVPVRTMGRTIGIVTTIRIEPVCAPDIGSYWARQAVSALEQAFSKVGGTSRFFNRHPVNPSAYTGRLINGNIVPMADALQALRAGGADALVVVGLHDDCDLADEIVSSIDIDNVPVVYIAWHEMRPPLTQVFYDNGFSGYQAAKHLLKAGYRKLTFVSPFHAQWLSEREQGARDAVRHAGLPPETLETVHAAAKPDTYERLRADAASHATMLPIFTRHATMPSREPWGIIAPNDHTAYAMMQAAGEAGLSAGVDFGLIGFDDDSHSSIVGLSSVRPPIDRMAEEAARLLLRSLQGEPGGAQVRLRSDVVARASTALQK